MRRATRPAGRSTCCSPTERPSTSPAATWPSGSERARGDRRLRPAVPGRRRRRRRLLAAAGARAGRSASTRRPSSGTTAATRSAAYWRQQRGYGKAEALLERKWPEKYNGAGHLTWSGRIYARSPDRSRYWPGAGSATGTGASALFQSVYERQTGLLSALPSMPEWYLVILALAATDRAGGAVGAAAPGVRGPGGPRGRRPLSRPPLLLRERSFPSMRARRSSGRRSGRWSPCCISFSPPLGLLGRIRGGLSSLEDAARRAVAASATASGGTVERVVAGARAQDSRPRDEARGPRRLSSLRRKLRPMGPRGAAGDIRVGQAADGDRGISARQAARALAVLAAILGARPPCRHGVRGARRGRGQRPCDRSRGGARSVRRGAADPDAARRCCGDGHHRQRTGRYDRVPSRSRAR